MKLILIIILLTIISANHIFGQKNSLFEIKFKDEYVTQFYNHNSQLKQVIDSLKNIDSQPTARSNLQKRLNELKAVEKKIYANFILATQNAKNKINLITSEVSFKFNGQEYDAIIINPHKQEVKLHWLTKENTPYKNLNAIKKDLAKNHCTTLMLTNGGMYLEGNVPQGLFISENKEYRPIDTTSNKYGNFYMKPNGILYRDGSGVNIITTDTFIKKYKTNYNILYATQSGPMLVINGEINHQFYPQSKNLNLRSGVGVLLNGNIVFIISRSNNTNFHDFASIFKDIFGCKNALYLDGAISKMYLKNLRPNDLSGNFGAIISVTSKRK